MSNTLYFSINFRSHNTLFRDGESSLLSSTFFFPKKGKKGIATLIFLHILNGSK